MMKRNAVLLCVVLLVALASCSKKSDDKPDDTAGKYYLTVKVDGVEKKATDQGGSSGLKAQVVYQNSSGRNVILISGRWRLSTSDLTKLGGTDLLIQPFLEKAGTYGVGAGSGTLNAINHWVDMNPPSDRVDDDIYTSGGEYGSGKIVVESFDGKEVRGTFQSTVVNSNSKTIKLSEGKFYMPVDMSRAK